MLQLKIDIVGNDFLTKTVYSEQKYKDIITAREAANECRNELFRYRMNGKFRDYTVDIIPFND